MKKILLNVLKGEKSQVPPVWLMRQAGRYLPEYQEIRQEAGGFLEMCDAPDFASEVTLQPLRRYGMDGAIIFADILLLPRALGQKVWFEPGVGPKLTPLAHPQAFNQLEFTKYHQILSPVYQALRQTKEQISPETTLLGFCGAPWTVACYMLNGGGSKDWVNVRAEAYKHPQAFSEMLTRLAHISADYLAGQVKAGADAVQVFDSWAGAVPPHLEELLIYNPVLELARAFKEKCPHTPLVLFSKNASQQRLQAFAQYGVKSKTPLFAALGLDERVDLAWAVRELSPYVAIQGNLDNALLLTSPEKIREETNKMLEIAAPCGRYIANLGHGVIKETQPENVAVFIQTIRAWQQHKQIKNIG